MNGTNSESARKRLAVVLAFLGGLISAAAVASARASGDDFWTGFAIGLAAVFVGFGVWMWVKMRRDDRGD